MGKLTEEQKRNAREFFRQNELAPPYDRELEELATILAPTAHVAHTAALVQALKACARLRMDDGTFCWCDAPERHVHLNHDLWCRQARVALDGQP